MVKNLEENTLELYKLFSYVFSANKVPDNVFSIVNFNYNKRVIYIFIWLFLSLIGALLGRTLGNEYK